jgi:hypothetical protein
MSELGSVAISDTNVAMSSVVLLSAIGVSVVGPKRSSMGMIGEVIWRFLPENG